MRSFPLLTTCALVLIGFALLAWLNFGSGESVDPLVAGHPAESTQPERDPADLARPADEVAEPAVEPVPVETPGDEVAKTSIPREAIAGEKWIVVQGRVIDLATGAGLAGCAISLVSDERARIWSSRDFFPSSADQPLAGVLLQTETEADGRFEFELRAGEMQADALVYLGTPEGWVALDDSHVLLPQEILFGCDLQFEAKPWPPPSAGDISGWLRAEKGSFPADAVPRRDHILLDLASTELPAINLRATLEPLVDEEGGVTFRFLFEDVPAGEYELTLSSLGNYRWDPSSLRVAPPTTGLEFLRFDLDEVVPLQFEIYDLATNEAIEDFEARHIKITASEEHGLLLHTGPIEASQFPRDQAFLWSVEAAGYAVAYGDEAAFTEEKDGRRVARIGLKTGWSARLLLMGGPRGSRPRAVAGGEVYLDGEFVGRSDSNGGLVVYAKEAPVELTARYPGSSESFWGLVEKRRSNVTPIVMTEPE